MVTGKTPFFLKGPFFTPHFVFLNIGYTYMVDLYGNHAFSILVLSSEKRYYNFLKKVFLFHKICFIVKVLKTFKISSDCHIKA